MDTNLVDINTDNEKLEKSPEAIDNSDNGIAIISEENLADKIYNVRG